MSLQDGVTTATKYYFLNGQRFAQKVGNGSVTYLHSDHLGSTVLTTGASGSQRYDAYGNTRSGTVPTDWKFTGQEQDGTGLIYLHARYYDPATGIFVSPDTIVPDPTGVFDYNRYMYGYGNPLKYDDPSGHCPICVILVVIGAALTVDGSVAEGPGSYTDVPDDASGTLGVALMTGGLSLYVLPPAVVASTAGGATRSACSDGDCANEVVSGSNWLRNSQSIWRLPWDQRGIAAEISVGRSPNLLQNFPVIDRWENGIATSIKSIDLTAKTYQNIGALENRIWNYISKLHNWQGASMGGINITPEQIAVRELVLVIPPQASQLQLDALYQMQQQAAAINVVVTLVTAP